MAGGAGNLHPRPSLLARRTGWKEGGEGCGDGRASVQARRTGQAASTDGRAGKNSRLAGNRQAEYLRLACKGHASRQPTGLADRPSDDWENPGRAGLHPYGQTRKPSDRAADLSPWRDLSTAGPWGTRGQGSQGRGLGLQTCRPRRLPACLPAAREPGRRIC